MPRVPAGSGRRPTPTYRRLREISDVEIVDANLGREIAGSSHRPRRRRRCSAWFPPPGACCGLRGTCADAWDRVDPHRPIARATPPSCVLLSRVTRAKCIVHVHVGFDPEWMRATLQRAIRSADARIAISDFVASTLRDAGCDPSSTYVVLNGIELARWQPRRTAATPSADELAIDDTTPVVLTVCRLFRAKGVSELVQAMHDVRDDVPTAVLLVVGERWKRAISTSCEHWCAPTTSTIGCGSSAAATTSPR